ncbi:MAG: type IV pilus assembly protein PilM [Candidatus Omnitrophica bacterium]|nr:type IV pilus assembly protein PilM [Candidatus Omnitrophota bacterium]
MRNYFFKRLFAKQDASYALDIGTGNIKFLSLEKREGAAALRRCVVVPCVDIPGALSDMVRKNDIAGIAVNISFSGSAVISRYVIMPGMSPSELKSALNFEAEKHIPFSISECIIDAAILKNDLPEKKMLVLLAAVKKAFLTEKIKVIRGSGLEINSVGIDSIALINAFTERFIKFQKDYKCRVCALLNIGASVSSLNILEGSVPVFNREISWGGNVLTEKIGSSLGIDLQSSEELKADPAEKMSSVKAACEPAINNLANEIRASFDYFESHSAAGVEKVFLSGGGSEFTGLDVSLGQAAGIEFARWDPLINMELDPALDLNAINKHKHKLAVAVGLAIG